MGILPRLPSPRVWVPIAVGLVVGLLALVVLVVHPAGARDAGTAALQAASDDAEPGSAEVLAEQPWGDGVLVLVGFTGPDGARHLGLAFVIDHGRGFRLGTWTSNRAELSDVRVGSLLLASSEGGKGQPPWTAAYGELGEDRITTVLVRWRAGDTTRTHRVGDAYLVVREGKAMAEIVRYLGKDDTEIAKVPV